MDFLLRKGYGLILRNNGKGFCKVKGRGFVRKMEGDLGKIKRDFVR